MIYLAVVTGESRMVVAAGLYKFLIPEGRRKHIITNSGHVSEKIKSLYVECQGTKCT